jgi:hypothetical protein
VKSSVAFVLFAFAAASAVATACTQRHRLGGRYDDGAGGEAGAADPPSQGSGASPSAGGSGVTSTGGTTGSGATGGTGGGAGSGATAGASGVAQQPDPGLLL